MRKYRGIRYTIGKIKNKYIIEYYIAGEELSESSYFKKTVKAKVFSAIDSYIQNST